MDGEKAVSNQNETLNLSAKGSEVGSGNTTTKTYSGSIAAYTTRSLSYDPNGNTLAPSGKTYKFDAQDRLVKVIDGAITTTTYYDGFSLRSRVVEQNGTTVTKDQRFVWLGGSLLGVFDQNGAIFTVTDQRFIPGGKITGVPNQ